MLVLNSQLCGWIWRPRRGRGPRIYCLVPIMESLKFQHVFDYMNTNYILCPQACQVVWPIYSSGPSFLPFLRARHWLFRSTHASDVRSTLVQIRSGKYVCESAFLARRYSLCFRQLAISCHICELFFTNRVRLPRTDLDTARAHFALLGYSWISEVYYLCRRSWNLRYSRGNTQPEMKRCSHFCKIQKQELIPQIWLPKGWLWPID